MDLRQATRRSNLVSFLALSALVLALALAAATPSTAAEIPPWDGNYHSYSVGDLVTYNGNVYECIQAHTSQPDWDPESTPALWDLREGTDPNPTSEPEPTATQSPDPTATPAPEPTQPPTGGVCDAIAWDASAVYTDGDVVSHNGHEWRAKWWTQGEEPGTTGEWGVWEDLGLCDDSGGDGDTEAPTAPANLRVAGTTSNSVSLAWDASSDNVGVAAYDILRSGTTVASTSSTQYTVSGLASDSTYSFTVQARDAAGNVSAQSNSVSATTQPGDNPDDGPGAYRKVGYFTQWSIYGRDFTIQDVDQNGQAAALTHINYAFANINSNGECFEVTQAGEGDAYADYGKSFSAAESVDGVGDTWDQPLRGNFNQLKELKAKHPHLKVLLSIGGWTWSRYFSDAALTAESRQRFVASCIDMFIKGNLPVIDGAGGPGAAAGVFDGIDLDWEWPGSAGHEHNIVRPEDKQNFSLLVQEFRRQLDQYGAEIGKDYLLTAFLPADPRKIEAGIEVGNVMPYFDFVTVQGYDFHGAWETTTNHQGNLYNTPGDPSPVNFSVNTAIQEYLTRGAPADKLVLGIPYYGRGWTGVPSANNGLFQESSGAAPGTWENGYDDYKVVKNKAGTRYRDEATGALWLYDGNEWWSYDDPQLIQQKGSYVVNNGLGGMMAWSLDGDDAQASLTRAIDASLP